MNTIGNWIANNAGLNKVWKALDGKKTIGAAVLGILTSLAGLGVEIAPLLDGHNALGIWGFIQQLPNDAHWLSLVASLGLLGIGHSQKKAAATAETPAP